MARRVLYAYAVILSGVGGYRNVWLRPSRSGGGPGRSATGSVYSVAWVLVEDADPPLPEPVLVPGVGEWQTTGMTLPRV